MRLFKPILEALNRSGVRYIVVGGVATVLQGYIRGTTDVDVVLDLAADNLHEALQELEAIGYKPHAPVPATDFADEEKRESWIRDKHMVVFAMRTDSSPILVDIFLRSPGNFEEMWQNSEVKAIDATPVRVASRDDLIRIKREAGRPKDLLDVAELEEIRKDLQE